MNMSLALEDFKLTGPDAPSAANSLKLLYYITLSSADPKHVVFPNCLVSVLSCLF